SLTSPSYVPAQKPRPLILVACSGGPDSLALAAATSWVANRLGVRAGAVVIDHQLQAGSAQVATWAMGVCSRLGLAPVIVRTIKVNTSSGLGIEAAAREARYEALAEQAEIWGAGSIMLGHTLEDQAETVLLRLGRGSGARALSAMASTNGRWHRPFLGVSRAVVRESAMEVLDAIGERPWEDPHNANTAFARVRVRNLLGQLSDALGPGFALGLARSASMLKDDADALDRLSQDMFDALVTTKGLACSVSIEDLAGVDRALRTRVIRQMCIRAGAPAAVLSREQVLTVDSLVTQWHGQGPAHLPRGVRASRECGRLTLTGLSNHRG
ncbi:MAG: tRNA lysidine(34) synthetase TilS, partial [Polynucleobacter sp.]